ncbi:hypothetical protein BTVI_82762 [Pitangus sulphuratus]|nr:hypothetical protein BTVI_82762 [Pitangus sulphuratus]
MEMALCGEFLFHRSAQNWVMTTILYQGCHAAIHSERFPVKTSNIFSFEVLITAIVGFFLSWGTVEDGGGNTRGTVCGSRSGSKELELEELAELGQPQRAAPCGPKLGTFGSRLSWFNRSTEFSQDSNQENDFVGMWRRLDVCKSEIINIAGRVDTFGQEGKLAAFVGTMMMNDGVEKSSSSLKGLKHGFCVLHTCPLGYNLTSANCHGEWGKSNAHCPSECRGEAGGSTCMPHGDDGCCPCWDLLPPVMKGLYGLPAFEGLLDLSVTSASILHPNLAHKLLARQSGSNPLKQSSSCK